MAPPATSAPVTGARTLRSMSLDLRAGRRSAVHLLLTLLLLVLLVMTGMDVARLNDDQARADSGYQVLRGLDAVLAGLAEAEAGQRDFLLTGEDDSLAPLIAGRRAVAREIDAVATLTADDPVQQQRVRRLLPLLQQRFTELEATVGLRRSRGPQAVRAAVLQDERSSAMVRIRSLVGAVQAEEEEWLAAQSIEAASATGRTHGTLLVVGLLLAAGAATVVSRSTRDEVGDARRAPEPATTSSTLSIGADETAARALQVGVIAGVAQQTELLALDAAIEAARARDAGTGPAVVTDEVGERTRDAAMTDEDVARRGLGSRAGAGAAVAVMERIPRAVAQDARAGDLRTGTAGNVLAVIPGRASGYVAARSRAHGPTTALWHAVEVRRTDGGVDGACETAVCGSLVRVSAEERWPVAARGVCPACATLAH